MPKTATRTFQYYYFTDHDEITHIGKKQPNPTDLEREFVEIITDMERWEFRKNHSRIQKQYVDELFQTDSKYIVSGEALSMGSSSSGNVDRNTIAERLQTIFPQGQIVLVLRNQLDALKSHYRQYLKFDPSIRSFEQWIRGEQEKSYRTTIFDHWNYDDLMRMYADQFENVHVLFFEDLVNDQTAFVEKLSSVLGITPRPALIEGGHENPSLTSVMLLWRTARTRFPPLSVVPKLLPEGVKQRIRTAGRKVDPSYTDDQRAFLTEFFAEGNRALRSEFDLPVDEYGYPF
jgi:hypothetical protein